MTGTEAGELEQWREADRLLDELLELPPAVSDKLVRLLAALEGEEGLLDHSAPTLVVDLVGDETPLPPTDRSARTGAQFGPYRVAEEIGRGGMSVVYRADRTDGHFEQDVALKILTRAQIAAGGGERFRREQGILARLRHPGIAPLLDGGVADDGTPWLAMERVDGRPLDIYAADRKLGAREIVALVLEVCRAVSFAHQNLVVHRDLKPGNILVDREGRPRLLDFGIAKLVDEAAAPDEVAPGTRILTPAYGAPEQFTGDAVTTATDVFGLGAVLYRLLTGELPFAETEASTEPPTGSPSRPSRLPGRVAGIDRELENVVLMALRLEPQRRYPSASALAEDLERWLDNRPVSAVPASFVYRARKLVQRQQGVVASTAFVLLALLGGLGATFWQAGVARRNAARAGEEAVRARRAAAEANAVTRFLVGLFSFAEPDRSQGQEVTARELLDVGARQMETSLETQPRVRSELLGTIGDIYRRLGLFEESEAMLEESLELAGEFDAATQVAAYLRNASLMLDRGRHARAEVLAGEALALLEAGSTGGSISDIEARLLLGEIQKADGRFDEAEATLGEVLARDRERADPDLAAIGRDLLALADLAFAAGRLEQSEELYEEALAILRRAHGGDHTSVAHALHSFGLLYSERGDAERALDLLEQALAMRRRLLGDQHPDVGFTFKEVGGVLRAQGRLDEAASYYERALDLTRSRLGDDHPAVIDVTNSLAILAHDRGESRQAMALIEEAVRRARSSFGSDHPTLAELLVNLAAIRRLAGELEAAERALLEALRINRATLGEETMAVSHNLSHLGNLYQTRGDLDRAESYYLQAQAATRSAVGERHPEYVAGLANMAALRYTGGRHQEAVVAYEAAAELAGDVLSPDHPLVIIIDTRWSLSLAAADQPDAALKTARRAEQAALRVFGEGHHRLLSARTAVGIALVGLGRVDEGENVLRNAREGLLTLGRHGDSLAAADKVLAKLDAERSTPR